jgi:hypothetical protein
MELYKVKEFNQLLTPKKKFDNVRTYYNLDKNLNFIPRLHEAGHQKTDIDGSLSWETSVIRNENVEELTEIPKHLMADLGGYSLDMNDLAEEDCGTYRFVNEIIIETENYELVADVFYNRDVKKISGTRLQPPEEETLSVQTNIDLKAIHIGDMEFLPFSKEQKQIIEKRLEDNIYYD